MTRSYGVLGALAVLAAFVTAPACEPGTGGRRVVFDLSIEPAPASRTFRTSMGWDVTLEEACVSIGPVYLYAQPGLSASWHRAYDWLVPSAHAHPGVDHFDGGEVRGEWLDQIALDVTSDGPIDLGAYEGIAGEVRSATIGVHPPRSTTLGAASCLRGHQAYVVGRAVKDALAVPFEGGLDIEAVGTKRRMQVSTALEIDERRRVQIAVDPRPWFDQVKFEELTVEPKSGRAIVAPGSQASLAWELGLQTVGAFRITAQ